MLKRLGLPVAFFLLVLAGCGEESSTTDQKNERPGTAGDVKGLPAGHPETAAQSVSTVQSTPVSLSGKTPHAGPNPHTRLTPEQHIAVALQHAEAGRMEEALDVLTREIERIPDHAGLLGARGSLLLGENKPGMALADLEKAVALAPNSALLLVNRSQAYRRFNRLEEALADLDKAVSLSPKLVPARFNRGVLLFGKSRYDEALADFDQCIALAPEVAGPYFNRAVTRDAMNDGRGAVSDLNRFLQLTDNPEWQKAARDTLEGWEKRKQEAAKSDDS